MTTDFTSQPKPLEELRYALAEAGAETTPAGLRTQILSSALASRPAGRAAPPPPVIDAVEAFRRTVAAFDALLSDLDTSDWSRPALRGLDVQGLVGHLIGVEHDFHAGLGIAGPAGGPDHIVATQPFAAAQSGRATQDTHRDWLAAATRTVDHVAASDSGQMGAPVTMHSVTLPLDRMLIVRAFEMWTHDEDIRRSTGRPLAAPEASRLSMMTELAVALLPGGLMRAGRSQPGRTARLVLTGPGGGTWQAPLGAGSAGPAEVRIIVEAEAFCRLVANRVDQAQIGAVVTGDQALAEDVFAGACALALD
jgi:uncharacterized protein (TIGR03083 family)